MTGPTKRRKRTPRVKITRKTLSFPNPFKYVIYQKPNTRTITSKLNMSDAVTSLERADEERDVQKRIQRYNAGILSQREHAIKALNKLEQERKMKKMLQKAMQAQNLTDEQRQQLGNINVDNISRLLVSANEPEKNKVDATNLAQELLSINEMGSGVIPLYKRLKPSTRIAAQPPKPEQHEQQQDMRDLRKSDFKKRFLLQHGIPPPASIVKESYPDTAEPLFIHRPVLPPLKKKEIGKIRITFT